MAATSFSTPLVGLDAVVLDTETTGLDARVARIVQVGAVKIHGAKILDGKGYEQIVNPGVPIPKATSEVHGITDDMVTDKPRFTDIIPALEAFLGPSIIIGHTISYDIAMLKREYELAGKAWRTPRALDIRVLAKLAAPTLAHHNLDRLCDWLQITVNGRHTAMGDAIATAQVFAALLPMLRQRNIRTLAEAEAATRQMAEQEARSAGGFMADVEAAPSQQAAQPLTRIDSFPYRHRVREVMSQPPVFSAGGTTVIEAVKTLIERKISSVYVKDRNGEYGIVTERDVLKAIHAHGEKGLQVPLEQIMNKPLQSVAEDAFVYRAIGRMDRLGFRHLAVRDANGEIVGAVTTRNLLRNRASTAIVLGDEIESANDAAVLGTAWAKLPHMARTLIEEDVDPRTIAAVISSEICILTRRAAQIAEARMEAAGRGKPPVRYAVLVLGSAGRGESLLAADQDNAIVFESGEPGGVEDKWFEEMATHMAEILDEVGVPFCKGGVMAKNALWRHSVAGWKEVITGWVSRHKPEDLLNVDIFFDGIGVHGDKSLADQIWHHAYDVGHSSSEFVMLLSEMARQWHAPFSMFGGIKTDQHGRVDLKKGGLMPIFTAARVLSIKHNARGRATPDRLCALAGRELAPASDIMELVEAHKTILGAMLLQQLRDTEQGIALSPRVDPERLGRDGKARLKEALGKVDIAVGLVSEGRL